MNPESLSPQPEEITQEQEKKPLLPEKARVRGIAHIRRPLTESQESGTGEKLHWAELSKNVGEWNTALELSDKIRDVVWEYVRARVKGIREHIPGTKSFPKKAIANALTHNWFEEVADVEGTEDEVRLAVAAHIVRRIENRAYLTILENANGEDLKKLGLTPALKPLIVDLMETTIKADPLFIRFLKYTQWSDKKEKEPPEDASAVSLSLPQKKKEYTLHSIPSLFPHESGVLAMRLEKILSDEEVPWRKEQGGEEFAAYLKALSDFYKETNAEQGEALNKEVLEKYKTVFVSGFPIILTPATEGYTREPYFDPEMRISVVSKDAESEIELAKRTQESFANHLSLLGQRTEQFSATVRNQPLKITNVFGGYGVGLTFPSVGQEKPLPIVYLNEQIRAYDKNFHRYTELIENSKKVLRGITPEELQRMSRFNTVFHELLHGVYPDDSPEAKRMGRKPLTIIDEMKAESIFTPLVREAVKEGVLKGNEKQWALTMLAGALQTLEQQDKDDAYFLASAYKLNRLIENGALTYKKESFEITDFEAYYTTLESAAKDIIALYENPDMPEKKTAKWIKTQCTPNKALKKIVKFLKDTAEKRA